MAQIPVQEQQNDKLKKVYNDLENIPELTREHIGVQARLNGHYLNKEDRDAAIGDRLHIFYVAMAHNFIETAREGNKMVATCLKISENIHSLDGATVIPGVPFTEYQNVSNYTVTWGTNLLREAVNEACTKLRSIGGRLSREREKISSFTQSDQVLYPDIQEEKAKLTKKLSDSNKAYTKLMNSLDELASANNSLSDKVRKNTNNLKNDAQSDQSVSASDPKNQATLHVKVCQTALKMLSLQNIRIELDLAIYDFLRHSHDGQDDTVKEQLKSAMQGQKVSLTDAFKVSDNLKNIVGSQSLFSKIKKISTGVPPAQRPSLP